MQSDRPTDTPSEQFGEEESTAHAPGQSSGCFPEAPRFEDIFSLEDIQRIQDAFAAAADVASVITTPEGHFLTKPSNFTALCRDIIRETPLGSANCARSDRSLGEACPQGPAVAKCLSGGLLDGATPIFFGKRHIATWFIGQVADESFDAAAGMAYAREIGADEDAFRRALEKVPRMSRERFGKVCTALYCFAEHLSAMALRNHQQSLLIDDLRQAQAELKTRDRNLADLIDFLPDPTMVVNAQGSVVFWNKAMEKLTGIAAVDMLGKSRFEYGEPFYGAPTPLLIDYARGAVGQPDARYVVADKNVDSIIAEVSVATLPRGPRHIWAKAVALRDDTGRITGGIEVIRDITDNQRADLALRESEEKFRRIVETANEGVWVLDAADKTAFVNRRMAAMLGCSAEEMPGSLVEPFLTEKSLPTVRAHLDKLRQGQTTVFEHELRAVTGAVLWVMVSASPLYDGSGRYIGALGMFTDITARKKIEEELAESSHRLEAEVEERTRDLRLQALELAEANIRLSELDRLKSAFLSTVSHELRTPLTSILGFAKLIGRDFNDQFLPLATGVPALEAKGRRIASNLAVVYGEAERLTRLINDVLDLNRIESGNMHWRDTRFNPLEVLGKAANSIKGLLSQRPEITFVLEMNEDVPEVRMDPDQLIQVVTNLLQNAVKFTREGTVRMTVRREGEAVELAIADSGIGIPPGELEAIFGKFHQVGRSDTMGETTKGTGLGLAICRQIVRHYGGRIWAESQLGQGSVFYVLLPGCDAAQAETPTTMATAKVRSPAAVDDCGVKTPDAARCGQKP
ncbi:PAS/PAC sensor signal transduction histidine kinase [Solidesulfovibrio fructosivorans JJ]]|uniref:histidine kinase n=1 Tax=Solidesulfovibrio fructosivorans JJ] TaxID=596151 RepID=E1JWA1_SOLFR|nr:PocR ligand-binding domain-containing protein [Solidesulfovibrio fructosivorans]EFL51461.1 PAS/PAC sensor signal transduction histidine kinase [Solidesulfovibrio fructosivorans JJ]]